MEIANLQERGKQLQLAELEKEIIKAIENNNWLKYEVLMKAYQQVKKS